MKQHTLGKTQFWWIGLALIAGFSGGREPGPAALAAELATKSGRIIQYRGPMPLLRRELWGGSVELKFELYRSPDGGSAFWKETRTVSVRTNGWVEADLGEVSRLPDEAFTTPFRFLAIWHGTIEFVPRKQVASLVYVAATVDQQIVRSNQATIQPKPREIPKTSQAVPDRDRLMGSLVNCGSILLEANPRQPTNWLEAMETASRLGARLPTFEEWYGAYEGKPASQLEDMTGHYEWVIPWVYEPTIHSRLHELYRGKPVACYYEELSPMNRYPFRLAVETRANGTDP